MPRLQVDPAIASIEMKKNGDRGLELVNPGPPRYVKNHDFDGILQEYGVWSAGIPTLLSFLFEDSLDLTAEWRAIQVGDIDESASLLSKMKALNESAERGVEWLDRLQDRLADIAVSQPSISGGFY